MAELLEARKSMDALARKVTASDRDTSALQEEVATASAAATVAEEEAARLKAELEVIMTEAAALSEASERDQERLAHLEMEHLDAKATISELTKRRDSAFEGETALSTSRADAVAQKMATERLARELRQAKADAERVARGGLPAFRAEGRIRS